ncbi:hypothetical protein SANTM175S_08454 [Streptomyces antimycoticus]
MTTMTPKKNSRRARTYAVALTAGALALAGCSSGGGDSDPKGSNEPKMESQDVTLGTAADSTGPAKDLPGAKKGGTVTVLQRDAFEHLDPGQIYVSDELIAQTLYNRTLTNYQFDDKTGKAKLVGDLATDTGKSSDGGRTWTYTLKDGLKYEDGSPITSKDVRQAVERLYAPYQTNGPTYLQQWLSGEGQKYRKALPGRPLQGQASALVGAGHPGRQDHRLPLRPAPCRGAVRGRHAQHHRGAAGQGHQGEVRQGPAGLGPVQGPELQVGQGRRVRQERPVEPQDRLDTPSSTSTGSRSPSATSGWTPPAGSRPARAPTTG